MRWLWPLKGCTPLFPDEPGSWEKSMGGGGLNPTPQA